MVRDAETADCPVGGSKRHGPRASGTALPPCAQKICAAERFDSCRQINQINLGIVVRLGQ
jgi:hypothetical protein